MAQQFLFLHGLSGSDPDHWQRWLAPRLAERGAEVRFPELPEPEAPDPDRWLDTLASELEEFQGPPVPEGLLEVGVPGAGLTVLCHSLSCLLWLRAAARSDAPLGADRVLLVAPPWRPDLPEVEPFLAHGAGAADVEAAAGETLIVASEPDPYCPPGAAKFAGPLGLELIAIPDAGHLNADSGYGPWPAVEAWALGEAGAWT